MFRSKSEATTFAHKFFNSAFTTTNLADVLKFVTKFKLVNLLADQLWSDVQANRNATVSAPKRTINLDDYVVVPNGNGMSGPMLLRVVSTALDMHNPKQRLYTVRSTTGVMCQWVVKEEDIGYVIPAQPNGVNLSAR